VKEGLSQLPQARLTRVLDILEVASSSWYRPPVPQEDRHRPGPAPKAIDPVVEQWVLTMALANPW
jgi:hypothetical protein